ncbi:Ribosomal-protein-S5p-alanine acetyltransferase [Planococcus halocryophilus Or1]|uniref:Alanine acetyltransferase n=1 Tax=Planococcus halocryophilus TaxID=1215089 RepID=A0A1C7DSX9_9BACL|nr:GNAT family protein [Planococcus halocryophilus]ANU14507.1 alanine acetyltransferase [Planococcus halocryophilus]EMF48147.1 Ribosomal-protein-S5p-alanine acetyltransferase [Planococcus halocryophilus Or1]
MKGEQVHIRFFRLEDAEQKLRLEIENRDFFEEYSVTRYSDFYTLAMQRELIEIYTEQKEDDLSYSFGIFENSTDVLVGTISLVQVIRGPLQSAILGYALDKKHNGKGYMTEAIKLVVAYAFKKLALHRLEAGVMPDHIASIRVLEKAGFHQEGVAIKNVEINGKWQDHQILAIINPRDD